MSAIVIPLLWKTMLAADSSESVLRELCAQATEEQLILLRQRFLEAVSDLVSIPRFAERADGRALELAAWIVTQGKGPWFNAKRNAEGLPNSPPDDAPDFAKVIADVFRERFGIDIPAREPDPAMPAAETDDGWEAEIWQIVDMLEAGVPPVEVFASYTRSEIWALHDALFEIVKNIAAKADELFGEDPDGFDWIQWADWAVGQGKEKCEELLAVSTGNPPSRNEDDLVVDSVLDGEYERRYGKLPGHT